MIAVLMFNMNQQLYADKKAITFNETFGVHIPFLINILLHELK